MSVGGRTVSAVLSEARRRFSEAGIADPATDARLLVAGLLGLSATEMLTRANAVPANDRIAAIDAAIERRLQHEPVHRILGEREFYGPPLLLSAGTLEPRPDTEILVDVMLPYLRSLASSCRYQGYGDRRGNGGDMPSAFERTPASQGNWQRYLF